MAIYTQTIEGTNTVFPISAYDPTNPATIQFTANWGDTSQEAVIVPRYNNRDREYYYEFQKTYEFPGSYTAAICARRISSSFAESVKQLVVYNVVVDSLTAAELLPTLKVVDIANFATYNMFYLNFDDDGVNRSWRNRQITIPVTFGNTIVGYLSASYSVAVSGTIGVSLSANQVFNQNWPLRTKLPFEVIERDNNVVPPVTTSLLKGFVYVYEAATKSAIFL